MKLYMIIKRTKQKHNIKYKKKQCKLDMVFFTYNVSTQVTEAGSLPLVHKQPTLNIKFQVIMD